MLMLYTHPYMLGANGYVPASELAGYLVNNAPYDPIEERYPALMCAAPIYLDGDDFRQPVYPPTIVADDIRVLGRTE